MKSKHEFGPKYGTEISLPYYINYPFLFISYYHSDLRVKVTESNVTEMGKTQKYCTFHRIFHTVEITHQVTMVTSL